MNSTGIQPCTVCGAVANSELLFDKACDGRGDGSIDLYRCRSCGIVYLGKYIESYDDSLYAYYQKYQGKNRSDIYNPLTRKSYVQVLRLFETYGGGKSILDVGCGKGDFVDAALSEGYDIGGIELSQPAIDIAQEFGLPVTKLDFFSGEIKNSSRDVLTMFEVIEHLPEPIKFLRRAEMVVKPSGLIYLTTPNFNSLDRRVLGPDWEVIHREHLTYFTPETLIGTIRNNTSLEVLHIETRNLSGELINHFRNLFGQLFPRNNRLNDPPTPKPIDLRTKIERSPWLLLLKRGANTLLKTTSLGSTIVILLRRPGCSNARH